MEKAVTVDSHVTIVRASDRINKFYLGYTLLQKQSEIERFSLGSTGQVELNKSQLENLKIVISSKKLQSYFATKYESICNQIANNEKQNQKLAELRDWLLPMLMNGQVTVKEAQESVNKAVEA